MRGLAPGELPRQHYRNERQKTEVRGLEVREKEAFRVRLLADELFVFTSLVPAWSSPSGVANATHLSVSSISSKNDRCEKMGSSPNRMGKTIEYDRL